MSILSNISIMKLISSYIWARQPVMKLKKINTEKLFYSLFSRSMLALQFRKSNSNYYLQILHLHLYFLLHLILQQWIIIMKILCKIKKTVIIILSPFSWPQRITVINKRRSFQWHVPCAKCRTLKSRMLLFLHVSIIWQNYSCTIL